MAENADIDRPERRSARIKFNDRVMFKPRTRPLQGGVVRDLSDTGAFLISGIALTPNAELTIHLPLGTGRRKKMCPVKGHVIRQEIDEQIGLFGYGVKFDESNEGIVFSMLREHVAAG